MPTNDTEQVEEMNEAKSAQTALVQWVMSNVTQWRNDRDRTHKERWEEYYRLWRGIWAAEDKTRQSERSRLITPALQQAIESVTSEIESAILDKPEFFDVVDNRTDTEPATLIKLRAQLRDDLEEADYAQALNQIFLQGSIFGTGIGKIDANDVDIPTIVQSQDGMTVEKSNRFLCSLIPVLPQEFAIDTAASNIEDALGCAHEYATPRHEVVALQDSGTYMDNEIAAPATPTDPILSDETKDANSNSVNICDYRGLVPRALLEAAQPLGENEVMISLYPEDSPEDEQAEGETEGAYDPDDMVEALIVIANEGTLLKAIENPLLLKDRLFVAYRHEIVPDQFWGRGVGEKGYNSQKALDASMRARIDGLSLTVHPMMGIDGTKMPHGFKFSVSPGKSIVTNGDPDTVLRPVRFGNIDPNVFTDNAELERMVAMSTGGMDMAAPVKANNRNETASGMSMMLGSMVKRAKRTIRNIEREMIIPLITKTHRAYMQYEPTLYPAMDVTYRVTSVLGTMARELEQQQFATMLNTVDQNSPAYWMLMKSIYSTSSLSNREDMLPMIDQKLQQAMQPPPPDPLLELKKQELVAKIKNQHAAIQVQYVRAQAEVIRAANDARQAPSKEAQAESQAILNLAKAQAESMSVSMQQLEGQLTRLEASSVADQGLAERLINDVTAGTAGGGA